MIDRKKFLLRSLAPILACSLVGGIGFLPQRANAALVGNPGFAAQNSTANQSTTGQTAPMTAAQKRAAKRAAKKEAKKQAKEQKAAESNSTAMKSEPKTQTSTPSKTAETRTATHRSPGATAGRPSSSEIASAKAKGMVWVNTGTRVYHTGGRYYGTTKRGQFMSLSQAQAAGYKAAKR